MIRMRDDELETTLFAVGRSLAYPRPTNMAAAVRARIGARPRPLPWWRRYALAPALVTALLLVLVVALGLPGVRAAAQGFLHLRGVDIFPVPSAPSLTPRPSGSAGGLIPGQRVSLDEARSRVDFTIRVPAQLGAPDEVYVDAEKRVTLVYRDRPGIPPSGSTGVSALVVEVPGAVETTFFAKAVGPGTTIEDATVGGVPAYWLEGAPHFFFYRASSGTILQDTLRLAGNTLVWTANGVTYRVEAQVSKSEAVAIASSLQ